MLVFCCQKVKVKKANMKNMMLQKAFQISKFKQHPSMNNLLWVDSRRSEYYLSHLLEDYTPFVCFLQAKTKFQMHRWESF